MDPSVITHIERAIVVDIDKWELHRHCIIVVQNTYIEYCKKCRLYIKHFRTTLINLRKNDAINHLNVYGTIGLLVVYTTEKKKKKNINRKKFPNRPSMCAPEWNVHRFS